MNSTCFRRVRRLAFVTFRYFGGTGVKALKEDARLGDEVLGREYFGVASFVTGEVAFGYFVDRLPLRACRHCAPPCIELQSLHFMVSTVRHDGR